jgi:hypothetical protein
MASNDNLTGEFQSPGGFIFGVQGWTWGEQRPTAITFMLDGKVKVSDQHGRPIKGTVKDNKPIYFDRCTHAQVVEALAAERIEWTGLVCAGWPQLPYEQLKGMKELPPTPVEELRKIKDPALRKDALRIRREVDAAREKEFQEVEQE